MSVSGQVSISSSIGTNLVFTVTGTNTLAYATTFQNILLGATTIDETTLNGTTTVGSSITQTPSGPNSSDMPYTLPLNYIDNGGAYTLPTHVTNAGDVTFVDATSVSGSGATDAREAASGPGAGVFDYVSVTGSGSDDYVLFTGNSALYTDVGGNNTIIFTQSNNTYEGGTSTGIDVIVTGSGYDTVNTGFGNDTVYSGTGHAAITLNDTNGGTFSTTLSAFNDKVYLDDGTSTVTALGVADAIFATAPDQTIIGGPNASAADIVTILQPTGSDSLTGAGDSIYGGGASIAVFDSVGGNTLFGDSGTGQAYFVAGPGLTDTINSSGGQIYAFGSDGDSINFSGSIGVNNISGFAAGLGNETLNGSGASGPGVLALFGATPADSVDASSINETLIGGSGLNGFVTGEGNETLIGGSGGNAFYVELNANPANITIQDFGSSDNNAVTFVGYTQDQVDAAEANATVGGTTSDPSYTIQLSDGTTVQFLGVSSLSGHTF